MSSSPIIPIIRSPTAAACAPNDASYVESSLADVDSRAYCSAGILLYDFKRTRRGERPVLRLLMGSNHDKKTEFLGGKKEVDDADVYATAAREFDEESGCILSRSPGDVSHRTTLERACRGSKVLWCGRPHASRQNSHADRASPPPPGTTWANLRCSLFPPKNCTPSPL
jgi:hypothetical protein